MLMISLDMAQNSFEFCQTADGSVLCFDTGPAELLTKIIIIKDGTERFVRAETKEKEAPPTKKSRSGHCQPRETSGKKSESKNQCPRDTKRKSPALHRFWKNTKPVKSTFNESAAAQQPK